MIKKILTFIVAALMILFTIVSAVNAESAYTPSNWGSYDSYYSNYNYYYYDYHDYGDYDNVRTPVVAGPYPRYALVYDNSGKFFHPDDFNHYDEFIGYRDLDVFNPDGSVDILRNPDAAELDTSDIHVPEDMQRFGYHVSGILPDGSIYRKHYMHDHEWDYDYYGYDCGYNYGYYNYYTPFSKYQNRNVYTNSCRSTSACQLMHDCC
ncbi:hypothetical protein JW756_04330 [Candidatus Woesearchaeota archaeon]|nr:hypothetical protein [Candidatus Woesearchaeota archaeon]